LVATSLVLSPKVGPQMNSHFETLVSLHNYKRLFLAIVAFNMLPVLISGLSNGSDWFEHAAFTAALVPIVACLLYVATRQPTFATKLASVLASWIVVTVFTAIFSDEFSNAYLSTLLFVVLVFLVYGPRFGAIAFALVVLSDSYHLLSDHTVNLAANLYALAIEATVSLLCWLFLSVADAKSTEALQAAATANRSNGEAQRLAEELSNLNRILLDSQDQERRRLARDIHDGPLQSMGVELLAVGRIKRVLEIGDLVRLSAEIEYLQGVAQETANELRNTVNALRNTLLDSGIVPALGSLARTTRESTGLEVEVATNLQSEYELPESITNCIYRLASEALNNIRKHANAARVVIHLLVSEEDVMLIIEDDGRGFDYEATMHEAVKQGHIGLYSMRERAAELGGSMTVTSASGEGTSITIVFPLTGIAAGPSQEDAHTARA
jgi:signal transduction histidine kinase